MKLEPTLFVNGEIVDLTAAQLDRVVFRGSKLALASHGSRVDHVQADCVFTVRDLVQAIEATELQTRGNSEWFDGIDVHHVFFEGLTRDAGGDWSVYWGS